MRPASQTSTAHCHDTKLGFTFDMEDSILPFLSFHSTIQVIIHSYTMLSFSHALVAWLLLGLDPSGAIRQELYDLRFATVKASQVC